MKKLRNRYSWLIDKVTQYGYTDGAEIGCKEGNTSMHLLKYCSQLNLICVDLWKYQPAVLTNVYKDEYRNWDFMEIKSTFDSLLQPWENRVKVLQGISWEMANLVEDNSLDFIFIDADHGYDSVKKDIIAWVPKVKRTGLIIGHDITLPGVTQAVRELIPHHKKTVAKIWFCKKIDYE